MIDIKNLRQLAEAANRPMSEIGLMEHKRAAMKAMHSELLPDDVLALLNALERKDAVLRTCLDACKCVLEQVKSPPVEVDFAIEAIYEELVCTKN